MPFNKALFKKIAREKEKLYETSAKKDREENRQHKLMRAEQAQRQSEAERTISKGLKRQQNERRQSFDVDEYVSELNRRNPKAPTQRQAYIDLRRQQDTDRKQMEKARKDYQKQREYEANKKIVTYEQSIRPQRFAGKANRFFGNTFGRSVSLIKHPAKVLYQYQGQERPRLAANPNRRIVRKLGARFSGRGRPYGTVKYVNPQTGQPIGVYEYRKILSAQLRGQRMQQNFQNTLSPRQMQTLQQADAQQRFQQSNIESRPIPDTNGQVNLRSIHQEADAYSHLFD